MQGSPGLPGRPPSRGNTGRRGPSRLALGAGESGGAPLEERGGTLLVVVGADQRSEVEGFDLEPGREAEVNAFVDGAFGRRDGERRFGGDERGDAPGFRQQV